jgi:hypothetical protein
MPKSPGDSFDPKRKFTAVGQSRGDVRQDSDWNSPAGRRAGSRGRAAGLRRIGWGGALLVVGIVAAVIVGAAALLTARARAAGAPRLAEATFVAVSLPQDGAFVPLHDSQTVVVESYAGPGISSLQLWINDQLWGTKTLDVARDRVTHTWSWVPSGEGEHHLVARAVDSRGSSVESPAVLVYASASLDALLPLEHTAQEGETVASLAADLGSTVDGILESNPGVDPVAPIPPGTELTIPIPFTGSPPSQTEAGEPGAPPVGPQVAPPGSSTEEVVAGAHLVQAGVGAVLWRDFELVDGKLKPDEPVDLLYLYLSVNGKDWGRVPSDPHDYLHPVGGVFDLTPELKQVAAQAGGGPVQIHADVWGWRQGGLTYLGSYFGDVSTEGGGLQTTISSGTELRVIDFVYLGKENYKQFAVLTGDDPDLRESFRWTTTLPGVGYALWQVSDKPFPAGSTLNPPGLVHQGISSGNGGKFDLDFGDYFWGGSGGGGGAFGGIDIPTSFEDLFGLTQDPVQQFNPWLAKGFFVRVIPMAGQAFPGVPGQVAGLASKTLVVIYTPKGTPYTPKTPPNGPVYEAHVVGWQPYRPADPDYAACTVMNVDWQSFKKGMPLCGCPGVKCSSSSSGCSISPTDWGDCVADAAGAFGSALGSLASFGANLYNGAVDFVTDTLSSVACGGLSGDAKKACEAGVGIAVKAGLASLGLPPEIPDFEKLMNEGLDYALAVAAEQLTAQLGFDCNQFCQDLVKIGIEGLSDPQKLYDDGLAFAVDRAADELAEVGFECDAECQGLIEQAAQGDLKPGSFFEAQVEKAVGDAVAALKAKGYNCGPACEDAIRQAMNDSHDLMTASVQAANNKPAPPPTVPHPLAVDQPAVVTVEIFRRWESAGIPEEDLNHCGLSLFTSETSSVNGTSFTFSPFFGKGIELPYLDPGETIRVPIPLDRKLTDITQAMIDAASAEAAAEAGPLPPAEENVVYALIVDPWGELYHGGTLQIKLSGPPFLTSAGGGMALPCVAEATFSTGVGEP